MGLRIWQAGTLTYTFGGLIALFTLLLLGDFAWSMRERSVGPMAQWYLSSQEVPNWLFAVLVSSLPAVIGLIVGPIISVRSDRHRSKWGRRIPYLLLTTPFAAIGMLGLGSSPFIAKWVHAVCAPQGTFGDWLHHLLGNGPAGMWLYHFTQNEAYISILCFSIFWTAFEFAAIAGSPIFYGLINDVVPRPLLGRFLALFRTVSLVDGMIFNWWILGLVPSHFAMIMIFIGIFFGLCFMAVCFVVKEGEYPKPDAPAEGGAIQVVTHEVRKYSVECFGNPYYLGVFFFLIISGLAFMPVNTFTMPFIKSLQVEMGTYGRFVTLTYAMSLILAYPLGCLADRFHPLRMVMGTLLVYIFIGIFGGFFATTSGHFLVVWVMHGFVSGCYYTSLASLAQRLFPQARYAQYASAAGILGSLAGIVFVPALGGFIDFTGEIYRYTFFAGAAIAAIALAISFFVYGRFVQYGGPRNYVAPE